MAYLYHFSAVYHDDFPNQNFTGGLFLSETPIGVNEYQEARDKMVAKVKETTPTVKNFCLLSLSYLGIEDAARQADSGA